jgi:DNA-binding XRE family transcriptional regulator
MTAQFPVHPDDTLQLLRIRRYLVGYRITNGWTQKDLSLKVNGTEGMAYDLESNPTWGWRLSRLQGWVKAFDLKLGMIFRSQDYDLEVAVEDDPEVAPLFIWSRTRDTWPRWQRLYLTSALTSARKHQGISRERLGQMLGITRKAVWGWESTADEVMLPKILHHARVLGGWIELSLSDSQE